MATEPIGTTPEGRLAHPPVVPETKAPLTSAQSTNAQLLAMILDQLQTHPAGMNDWKKNVLFSAALAAELGYDVQIDAKGWVHIWLPLGEEGHLAFFLGLAGVLPGNALPIPGDLKQTTAVDAYFESTIPAWQRARIKAVAEGREGEDAGC